MNQNWPVKTFAVVVVAFGIVTAVLSAIAVTKPTEHIGPTAVTTPNIQATISSLSTRPDQLTHTGAQLVDPQVDVRLAREQRVKMGVHSVHLAGNSAHWTLLSAVQLNDRLISGSALVKGLPVAETSLQVKLRPLDYSFTGSRHTPSVEHFPASQGHQPEARGRRVYSF